MIKDVIEILMATIAVATGLSRGWLNRPRDDM